MPGPHQVASVGSGKAVYGAGSNAGNLMGFKIFLAYCFFFLFHSNCIHQTFKYSHDICLLKTPTLPGKPLFFSYMASSTQKVLLPLLHRDNAFKTHPSLKPSLLMAACYDLPFASPSLLHRIPGSLQPTSRSLGVLPSLQPSSGSHHPLLFPVLPTSVLPPSIYSLDCSVHPERQI